MRALLWIVLALTALFAALNWPAFNTPQPLWLGFATVTAPLGVLMLGALAVIALLVLIEQSVALAHARRYAREMEAQRRLVEKAEGSRYTELRAFLTEEIGRAEQRTLDTRTTLIARLDALERDVRAALAAGDRAVVAPLSAPVSAPVGEYDRAMHRGDVPPPVMRR